MGVKTPKYTKIQTTCGKVVMPGKMYDVFFPKNWKTDLQLESKFSLLPLRMSGSHPIHLSPQFYFYHRLRNQSSSLLVPIAVPTGNLRCATGAGSQPHTSHVICHPAGGCLL